MTQDNATKASADAVRRNRPIEVTILQKDSGILSKRISLDSDGKVVSDGSLCKMWRGRAKRRHVDGLAGLAAVINGIKQDECLSPGALRADLGDDVEIASKRAIENNPGSTAVARTAKNINYRADDPAFVLLDYDLKDIADAVVKRVETAGGYWAAIVSICEGLAGAGYVIRRSTSSGLSNADTGQTYPASMGVHVYVEIEDGADAKRFLYALHDRAWLAGFGWYALGKDGKRLERSLVDRMVGHDGRLVFESAPEVVAPLRQDAASRRPEVHAGNRIDTRAVAPSLTPAENQAKAKLLLEDAQRVEPERKKRREAYVSEEVDKLRARHPGMTHAEAKASVEKRIDGDVLSPDVLVPFDDEELLAGKTVGDVLDAPEMFEGVHLADPIEGGAYGAGKATIFIGDDGLPFINSFAHGGRVFRLRWDFRTIAQRIEAAADKVGTFVKMMMAADVDAVEEEKLVKAVAKLAGVGVRPIKAELKEARGEQNQRRKEAARERKRAERNDSRPEMPEPRPDAPLTEEMTKINSVIGGAPIEQQPRRDLEGHIVKTRWQSIPGTHAFGGDDDKAPDQWTIVRLNEYAITEEIERFINYVDEKGNAVRPPMSFVKAYTTRDDRVLATLAAIATEPIVLADGEILGRENGFDRARGIQFIIPDEVLAALPRREDCTPEAIAAAMNFLIDEWLVDVEADFEAKCSIVASAATLIERSVLSVRPVFFVTAGRAGGGKTTTIYMAISAVTGNVPAAQAWTGDENERRKALHSHLMAGAAYIVWDNIPRGERISCPHIERSCTTAYYVDRKLGVSETVMASAATIHFFTGNNIESRGDLSSRAINIRVKTERPDPEDRPYRHSDPLAWTTANRGAILRALYTVLLGNPKLREARDATMRTRFKTWYRIVGSAIEHAAELAERDRVASLTEAERAANPERVVDFQKLLRKKGEEDDDDGSLGEILAGLDTWAKHYATMTPEAVNARSEAWRNGRPSPEPEGPFRFKAAYLRDLLNKKNEELSDDDKVLREACRAFLYPGLSYAEPVDAKSVSHRLKRHVDEPISHGDRTLILRTGPDPKARSSHPVAVFWVEGRENEGAGVEPEGGVKSERSEAARPCATEENLF